MHKFDRKSEKQECISEIYIRHLYKIHPLRSGYIYFHHSKDLAQQNNSVIFLREDVDLLIIMFSLCSGVRS